MGWRSHAGLFGRFVGFVRARRLRELAVVALAVYAAVAAAGSAPARAATQIGSTTYTTNTTWTVAGSPYVLNGNVDVAAGATLTIQPGVIVKFNGGTRQLFVDGTLNAVGTASNPIAFTSYQDDSAGGDTNGDGSATTGAPGQWYNIDFGSSTSRGTFSYAQIRYGSYAGSPQGNGAIWEYGAGVNVSVDHSTISNNQGSGVLVGLNSTASLTADTITGNGDGVFVNTGTAAISGSTISSNSKYGLYYNLPSGYTPPVSTLSDSDVTNNSSDGINISLSSTSYPLSLVPYGSGNNIYGNADPQLYMGGVNLINANVDWNGNYWGQNVYAWYEPPVCQSTSGYNAASHLSYSTSNANPPAGPITSKFYIGGTTTYCSADAFNITDYAPAYIDHTTVELPIPQSFGDCSADNEAENPNGCDSEVDNATGGFNQTVTDLSLAGIGVPFALTRSYNSLDRSAGGPLGPGWTHSYAATLGFSANGDIVYRSGSGQQLHFAKQADGSYLGDPGSRATLTASGGAYQLVSYDQIHYGFDSSGKLTSETDRNGQGLTFAYNANSQLATATDSAGRVITFSYDPTSGLLTQVALPDGRKVQYGYTSGLLTSVIDARGGTTTYSYDANNFLSKAVDQNNHTVFQNTYDSKTGRLTQSVDALNHTTTYSWNPSTQTQTITDPRGKTWQEVFSNGVLKKRIDPLGDTIQYGYDADMNQTSLTDARGNTTTMTYDTRGNMLTRTAPAPLSYQETWNYDSLNDVTSYTDGRGNTTSYGYDTNGNLTAKTQPGSIVTQYGRDPGGTGLLVSLTDPRGKTTTYGYDSQHNLTSITSPLGEKTTMGYDSSGRLTSKVDPRGNVSGANPADYTTSYAYDNADNKTSQTDANGHTTSWAYDPVGSLTSATDANNHTISYAYDAANELTSVTAPGTATTSYTYDANGNLTGRTDPNNHVTSYSYDDANRRTGSTDPLNRSWSYSYDANGNLASTTAPAGGTASYTYDALNRRTQVSYSDTTPTVTYAYDGDGNRSQMVDGAGAVNYSYDALNRLTAATRGSDTFSYSYDAASNLTSRTYPDNTVTSYSYDDDERLASATSAGNTTSYSYDPAGELIQTTRPSSNGWNETRSYDHAGQLTEIKDANGASTLQQLDYAYDPVGNATSLTRLNGVEYYEYDNRDRLTKVCYATTCDQATDMIAWTYDGVGNRLTEVRPAGTTSYTYDAADQLTQTNGPGGTTTYSYDPRGNQTAAGTTTYTYNLANQLTGATVNGTATSYSHDGDGNRLTATTGSNSTSYLWDTNNGLPQLAIERDGSGNNIRTYIRGLDMIALVEGGSTYYYHHDRLGSVTALTSSSGAIEWTYTYEPFGTAKTTTKVDPNAPVNPLGFDGQYQDPASSLYDMRARQYDPAIGLFTSADSTPAGPTSPYEATYDFAGQDPVNSLDPAGTTPGGVRCYDAKRSKAKCGSSTRGFVQGLRIAGTAIVNGVKAYGNGSLSVGACVFECVSLVGYHGRIYVQTGEKGLIGFGPMWSKQGPYRESDNATVCYGACISRSVESGTGNSSWAFGLGFPGVEGGHATLHGGWKLPWSRYP